MVPVYAVLAVVGWVWLLSKLVGGGPKVRVREMPDESKGREAERYERVRLN